MTCQPENKDFSWDTQQRLKRKEEGGRRRRESGKREGKRVEGGKDEALTIPYLPQVSCLAMNGEGSLIASGQTGSSAVVRVWECETGRCLALFQTHSHSLRCLR